MKRTHTASVHRPKPADPAAPKDPYTPGASEWDPVAAGVRCNLQPLTGSVEQSAAGREVDATWQGFFPAGVDLQEDDGILVTSGVGPQRFRVKQVGEQGAPWDTEVLLDDTAEVFP